MSLKEAVGALRSLKAELEASRRSKLELDVAHRGLIEELRIARQGQQQRTPNGEAATSPEDDSIDSCNASATEAAATAAALEEVEARERNLEEKLLEAKHALEERDALDEEARILREELASVKAGAEASTASIQRELQQALAERDKAMGASEGALCQLEVAKCETTKQEERAMAAEKELAGAAEDASLLRTRLGETCKQLESAQDALEATKTQESSGNGDGRRDADQLADADDAAVAELESELRSVREAVAVVSSDVREPPRAGSPEVDSLKDVAESAAQQRADHLQTELDSALRENLEIRESLKSTLQKQKILEEVKEENDRVAASDADVASELATEKDGEIESLRGRLTMAESKLEQAEQAVASEKATTKENALLRQTNLEETGNEIAALKASLSETVSAREAIERSAASDAATKSEKISFLQGTVDTLREEMVGAAETARAAMTVAEAEAAAAAGTATARIVELEAALQEAEASMAYLREVAASVAETRQEEIKEAAAVASAAEASAAADIAEALKSKETAQEEARELTSRASAAEASVVRLKFRAGELKASRVEAKKEAKLAEKEKNSAVAAVAEANAGRESVEETLLMANKELQRLRGKWEEAESEAEKLRAESERLKSTAETLRSSAAAVAARDDAESTEQRAPETDKEAEVAAGTEVRDEISRLRKTIEELEEALKVKSGDGGDKDGGGGRLGGRGAGFKYLASREQDGAEEDDGETAQTTKELVEERGRLRTELRLARKEAETRAAGLEMQLDDKEREAADTQRRLYHRQTELESELEELSANHDALRVEMARMDATMQDAVDASSCSSPSSVRGGVGNGGGGTARNGRDAVAMGAEVGGAVGDILRGKFWSGWGGSGASGSGVGGVGEGEGRRVSERSAAAAETVASGGRTKARKGGGGSKARGEAASGASIVEDANRQSISRVRDTMMARLHEAANKPIVREGGEEEKQSKSGTGEVEQAGETTPDRSTAGGVENEEGDAEAPGGGGTGGGWTEETMEHPAPDYGVDSPVIRYLLQQWSSDPYKLKYLSLWLRCVIERREVPDAFPSGLQLVGLAPEIKDGFLTLVVPMIRFTGGLPVLVHSRLSPPEESASISGTPDAGNRGPLWDLRVKVDLQGGVETTQSEEDGVAGTGEGGRGDRGGARGARAGRAEGQRLRVQEDVAVPQGRKKGPR